MKLPANWRHASKSHIVQTVVITLVVVLGVTLLFTSHAATPVTSIEAESNTPTSPATIVSDGNASGGKAVQFGTESSGGTSGARGWAKIVNNTLVSDQGTLLRGGTLWLIPEDAGQYYWAISTPTSPDTDGCSSNCGNPWPIFTQYRLNTVRIATDYGPNEGSSLATTETQLAAIVNQATINHMYAVIDLHEDSGGYDLPTAKVFWAAIAAQFKNNTNVIFELLNEPVAWRPENYTAQNVQDEETLYNIVRAQAPQTPVIMMTFAIPENTAASNTSPTMTEVSKELTGINWTNTAVGFHGYWVNTDAGEVQLKQNFPAIETEYESPCNEDPESYCVNDNTTPSQVDTYQNEIMEELGISWICWDCNSTPNSSSKLAAMEASAQANDWLWAADNP